MRILMLANRLISFGGGAERLLVALATHLPPERFKVVVCTTRPNRGPLYESFRTQGIELIELDRRSRFDLRPLVRLVSIVRSRRFHVLHSHMFGSNVWGTLVGSVAGVRAIVAQEHSWSYEGDRLRLLLDGQLIGRFADAFVAVSRLDAERMVRLEGVPREKVVVIPNAYVPRPSAEEADWRRRLGLAADAPVIGTAAVMRAEKALEVLVEAFAQVRRRHPDAALLLAGDGPCRAALERRAAELGVADGVHFLGYVDDVGGLLEACDVAALSSDREGTPLFAIECMAHRVPLVSTDVGGIGELLDDRSVVLTPRRDPAALADAIAALLSDPARRAAIAAAAAKRLAPYEIDNVVARFTELYERLVAANDRNGVRDRRGRS